MSGNAYPAVPGGPKRRPGLSLARRNQKILAEKLHWPEGALKTCWELERRFPGWQVDWMHENTIKGFERPAGFRALRDGHHRVTRLDPDAKKLAVLIEQTPDEHCYEMGELCLFCVGEA